MPHSLGDLGDHRDDLPLVVSAIKARTRPQAPKRSWYMNAIRASRCATPRALHGVPLVPTPAVKARTDDGTTSSYVLLTPTGPIRPWESHGVTGL